MRNLCVTWRHRIPRGRRATSAHRYGTGARRHGGDVGRHRSRAREVRLPTAIGAVAPGAARYDGLALGEHISRTRRTLTCATAAARLRSRELPGDEAESHRRLATGVRRGGWSTMALPAAAQPMGGGESIVRGAR